VGQVALETSHAGPHLPREAKPLRLCAGLQTMSRTIVTTFSSAGIRTSPFLFV
jgi:hypothetical protein